MRDLGGQAVAIPAMNMGDPGGEEMVLGGVPEADLPNADEVNVVMLSPSLFCSR